MAAMHAIKIANSHNRALKSLRQALRIPDDGETGGGRRH
jgi:hypothetical protein